MTTIISRQEKADLYNRLNDITRILSELTSDGDYRTGQYTEMARIINVMRGIMGQYVQIQEDILRTSPAGLTDLDPDFDFAVNECEVHGLYVSDYCPGCDNAEKDGRNIFGNLITNSWDEDAEDRAREIRDEQLKAVKDLAGGGA